MPDEQPLAPYHAHIYVGLSERARAEDLQRVLHQLKATSDPRRFPFIGGLREQPVGPHPLPQFEIHFSADFLPEVLPLLRASGLRALVHPLTDDDLADHTRLAQWIGEPIALDLSTLDPPGSNQGVARYGTRDF